MKLRVTCSRRSKTNPHFRLKLTSGSSKVKSKNFWTNSCSAVQTGSSSNNKISKTWWEAKKIIKWYERNQEKWADKDRLNTPFVVHQLTLNSISQIIRHYFGTRKLCMWGLYRLKKYFAGFETWPTILSVTETLRIISNYSSSPNGLCVNSPKGRMGYWLRGHEGERNNCFSKIQLVGQKSRDKKTLAS